MGSKRWGCSGKVRESYGVRVWKAIRRWCPLVNDKVSFVVGNGQRVRFWKDTWCGQEPLCNSFP